PATPGTGGRSPTGWIAPQPARAGAAASALLPRSAGGARPGEPDAAHRRRSCRGGGGRNARGAGGLATPPEPAGGPAHAPDAEAPGCGAARLAPSRAAHQGDRATAWQGGGQAPDVDRGEFDRFGAGGQGHRPGPAVAAGSLSQTSAGGRIPS